jgi:hypothetical protein
VAELYHYLAPIIWFVLGGILLPKLKQQIEYPYKFVCPEKNCNTTFRFNNKAFLDEIAESHKEQFHSKE